MGLTAERLAMAAVAPSPTRRWTVITAHAFVGWLLCGASMWIGLAVTTEENAS